MIVWAFLRLAQDSGEHEYTTRVAMTPPLLKLRTHPRGREAETCGRRNVGRSNASDSHNGQATRL